MKRILRLAMMLCVSVFLFTSCVKEYKTVHICDGVYKIKTFEDLERLCFARETSVTKISHIVSGFCIYGDGDSYHAYIHVDITKLLNDQDQEFSKLPLQHLQMDFNADKEITGWKMEFDPADPDEGEITSDSAKRFVNRAEKFYGTLARILYDNQTDDVSKRDDSEKLAPFNLVTVGETYYDFDHYHLELKHNRGAMSLIYNASWHD